MSNRCPLSATIALIIVTLIFAVNVNESEGRYSNESNRSSFQSELCPSEVLLGPAANIGSIQGSGLASPCEGIKVSIQGVVTGIREDQNLRGARFYTFFVQDPTGHEDGDESTSDGIAVFTGPNPPLVEIGDLVKVDGMIKEYFGLTEIDYYNQEIFVMDSDLPQPVSIPIEPPGDNELSIEYFEKLEGMLVDLDDGLVIGPTHQGCGFSAISGSPPVSRITASSAASPTGRIINVMNNTDVSCLDFPQAAVGDRIEGVVGPLTYEFEQYKVIQQQNDLLILKSSSIDISPMPIPSSGQLSVASYNLNDFFEKESNEDNQEEWEVKLNKITDTVDTILHCPSILGLQEVETRKLLEILADRLVNTCGFQYEITMIEGPDGRGINNAVMTNPQLVEIQASQLRQTCSEVVTEVEDPSIPCSSSMYPLFSRPPLQLSLTAIGKQFVVFANHFKSKRGGEQETADIRQAQAQHLKAIVEESTHLEETPQIIVLGDFNDFEDSAAAQVLKSEADLINILNSLSPEQRFTYIFGGASQLVDWILVSDSLSSKLDFVSIAHVNADYPYLWKDAFNEERPFLRSSDHDIPFAIFQIEDAIEALPTTAALEAAATQEDIEVRAEPSAVYVPAEADAELIILPTAEVEAQEPSVGGGEENNEASGRSSKFILLTMAGLFAIVLLGLVIVIRRNVDQR